MSNTRFLGFSSYFSPNLYCSFGKRFKFGSTGEGPGSRMSLRSSRIVFLLFGTFRWSSLRKKRENQIVQDRFSKLSDFNIGIYIVACLVWILLNSIIISYNKFYLLGNALSSTIWCLTNSSLSLLISYGWCRI